MDEMIENGAPKPDSDESLNLKLKEGTNYDRDRNMWERQKAKYAIWFALVSVLVAITAIVYRPSPITVKEPYLVRFNSETGIVDVATRVVDGLTTYEESLNKYFVWQYVLCRESYALFTYDKQWKACDLFTPENQKSEIWSLFNIEDAKSHYKRYGKTGTATLELAYTKPTSEANKYEVHFVLVEVMDGVATRSNYVSSVKFVFNSKLMKNEDRLTNPLGFQVLAYRRDMETVPSLPTKEK
jgi:type IV secretion system protein VirB8